MYFCCLRKVKSEKSWTTGKLFPNPSKIDGEWARAVRKKIKANGQVVYPFLLLLPLGSYCFFALFGLFALILSCKNHNDKNYLEQPSSIRNLCQWLGIKQTKPIFYDSFINQWIIFKWSSLFSEMPISEQSLAAL